jgi:hypothetical protein
VWVVGSYYPFEFTYTRATGVTTWKIDFNIDGDFADPSESVTSTSPTLVGYGFRYLNLWMSGSAAPGTVDVKNFTVNGTNLGGFTSNNGTTPIEWTWTDSSSYFGDVTVTGEYRMSATGSADESNRMWIRLGDPVLPPPVLEASTTDPLICTGETTDVFIDLANVVDLYGYQFEVSYDTTYASAVGAFDYSFFDVDQDGAVPGGSGGPWDATCSAGTCSFSRTELGPDPAVTGSGPLAKITLTGVAPGSFSMAIGNDVLSDIDGIALPHALGGPLTIDVCGFATVSGFVTLQGRLGNNVDAGTVTLTEQDAPPNFAGPYSGPFSASDGAYSINVPYMPGGSSYKILAGHGLYLDNSEVFNVAGNATKSTRLWGGDANNDGNVKMGDLSCIGGDFGGAPSTCGGLGSSDINADGTVNIQDLSIAGGNFDKCGAQPWDWVGGTPVICVPGP